MAASKGNNKPDKRARRVMDRSIRVGRIGSRFAAGVKAIVVGGRRAQEALS
jgi:hypothetical protein